MLIVFGSDIFHVKHQGYNTPCDVLLSGVKHHQVDEKLFVFEETNHAYSLLVQKQNSKAKNIR